MTSTHPSSHRTCIVLGGHGFVGSAVVAEANKRGYEAHAVGRDEYKTMIDTSCDLLINANGNSRKYISREDPLLDFKLSVESVLRSFRDFKTDQYVFLSSIDVYEDVGHPAQNHEEVEIDAGQLSRYGFHKYLAEQIVRYEAADGLILRMGGFVGPSLWKNSVFDLLTGTPLRVHLDSVYQYMHTKDLARILFDLIEAGVKNTIYNVVGQGTMSLRDVAEMVPDAHIVEADELPKEHYEINVDRLAAQCDVPQTKDTLWQFMNDVVRGRIRIGKTSS